MKLLDLAGEVGDVRYVQLTLHGFPFAKIFWSAAVDRSQTSGHQSLCVNLSCALHNDTTPMKVFNSPNLARGQTHLAIVWVTRVSPKLYS